MVRIWQDADGEKPCQPAFRYSATQKQSKCLHVVWHCLLTAAKQSTDYRQNLCQQACMALLVQLAAQWRELTPQECLWLQLAKFCCMPSATSCMMYNQCKKPLCVKLLCCYSLWRVGLIHMHQFEFNKGQVVFHLYQHMQYLGSWTAQLYFLIAHTRASYLDLKVLVRFCFFNLAPLVDSEPHRAPEHVYPCIAQGDIATRRCQVNCKHTYLPEV